uniref:Protein kinase domain-containing protein n=1 Tax=Meloidogyne enterolobii TaxID=390850 RepID=A0A6V7V9V0_MELEN|nr:unnamed protein product [Meloidogyne enterolobii]
MYLFKIFMVLQLILLLQHLPVSLAGCKPTKHKNDVQQPGIHANHPSASGTHQQDNTTATTFQCVHGLEFDLTRNIRIENINIFYNLDQEYKIGQGGFGQIYHAYHEKDKRCVALKITNFSNETRKKIAENEVKVLNHIKLNYGEKIRNRIINIYGNMEIGGRMMYTVLELCGSNLLNYFHAKMGELEDTSKNNFIMKILKSAAIAIKQLHDKNIIHLDIKLDNFVLGYKSNQTSIVTRPVINLKLIDFNSSVISGWDIDEVQLTTMNSVLKPPELERNDIENLSKSADIWAFGLMSYEIVYGELPKGRPELLEVLESYRNDHSYNSRLDILIKNCIAVDPNERPDIDQISREIDEILAQHGHK